MSDEETDARSAFSRRHYIKVAEVLGKNCVAQDSQIIQDFITMFREDNPAFSSGRFTRKIEEECRLMKEEKREQERRHLKQRLEIKRAKHKEE